MLLALALGRLLGAAAAPADPAPIAAGPTLYRAAAVLALSAETANTQLPVDLTGTVTAAEADWQGKCFLEDASGGVFVLRTGPGPAVGDIVHVRGFTGPGAFAPIIHATSLLAIGTGPLPAARQMPIERLMTGAADSQRVELSGLIRAVHFDAVGKVVAEVAVGAYRVRVLPKLPPKSDLDSLIGAEVLVRGTATTSFNAALRQLTAVNVFVPTESDFVIERREAPPQPFSRPIEALADVARYRPDADLAVRRHVRGIVTFQRFGEGLYLQDASGGLELQTAQATPFAPGTTVDAVGFLEFIDYQPVLTDAVCRAVAGPLASLPAKPARHADIAQGSHRGELIVLEGRLLNRSFAPVRRPDARFSGRRVLLTLQSPNQIFTAEREIGAGAVSALELIPLGSLVRATGVASFVSGDDGRPQALKLLLPEDASLAVIRRPSWFTAERLMFLLGGTCLLLAAVAGWSVSVSQKNAMLRTAMADREGAQRALLSERTRLATELHDTLEQAMTGIALQLDAASRLFPRDTGEAARRLELARTFLRQSQVELRRSIWDLRSRELEQFDLGEALEKAGRQIAEASGLKVDCETVGERRRLPEIVEENLLRIGQEALTNVVKHSGATWVTIRLEVGPRDAALEIKDNGRGLDPATLGKSDRRGFGLVGMSERAKRLGGRFAVVGLPGEGTTVRVSLNLAAVL